MGFEVVRNIGSTAVWGVQSACVAGFAGLCIGKAYPEKSAGFFSKTAGYSLVAALASGILYDALFVSDKSSSLECDKKKEEEQELKAKWAFTLIGGTLATVGSFFYHKEFPLIYAVTSTFLGTLGSIGTFALMDYVPKSYPAVWTIQSACTAGIAGLYSSELFEGMGAAKIAGFASKTAGFSMAIGVGTGIFCDSLAKWISGEKRAELKEKPALVILSGAAATLASYLFHKEFPLAAAVSYACIGILGSVGAHYAADAMTFDRATKIEKNEKPVENVSLISTLLSKFPRKSKGKL